MLKYQYYSLLTCDLFVTFVGVFTNYEVQLKFISMRPSALSQKVNNYYAWSEVLIPAYRHQSRQKIKPKSNMKTFHVLSEVKTKSLNSSERHCILCCIKIIMVCVYDPSTQYYCAKTISALFSQCFFLSTCLLRRVNRLSPRLVV